MQSSLGDKPGPTKLVDACGDLAQRASYMVAIDNLDPPTHVGLQPHRDAPAICVPRVHREPCHVVDPQLIAVADSSDEADSGCSFIIRHSDLSLMMFTI
jgi:hypothetical protein